MSHKLSESSQLLSINKNNAIDEQMNLLWYFSKKCNYDCSYCSELLHDKTSDYLVEEKFQVALRNLSNCPISNIQISISGGEPYLDPGIIEKMKALKNIDNKKIGLHLTSNGSANLEKYVHSLQCIDSLTISSHLEFSKTEIFLKKMKALQKESSFVINVNVMFLPGTLKDVSLLMRELRLFGLNPRLRRIRSNKEWGYLDYSERELNFIKKDFESFPETHFFEVGVKDEQQGLVLARVGQNEITALGLNEFKGWDCMAGSRSSTIWNDGSVYSCEAGFLEKRKLGNFYDESFKWIKAPMTQCPLNRCVCVNDIGIPKSRF